MNTCTKLWGVFQIFFEVILYVHSVGVYMYSGINYLW
jgi:hypothetical protein